jgi:chromosome segregation ATPase
MIASRPHPVQEAIESYREQAKVNNPGDENLARKIDASEVALNSLERALANYEEKLKGGASSATLDGERADIENIQTTLRSAINNVQDLLGHDSNQRLQDAKNNFKSSPFSTRSLGDFRVFELNGGAAVRRAGRSRCVRWLGCGWPGRR